MKNEDYNPTSHTLTILMVLAVCVILFFAFLLSERIKRSNRGDYRVEVRKSEETQIKHDTIIVRQPISRTDTIVRYVSIPIPSVRTDTMIIARTDTIYIDGDSIRMPITQKVYRDSSYTAYVSGWHPALDSIAVFNKTITHTIKTETEIRKIKKWNVGVIAGYGFGISHRELEPFVGVGITYNLLK